ncbi:MAG TPA: hypothetical protein VFE12_01555 [Acetobacteraceae bacterium]|jgi:hypothetical protein|nr:hypothetical protein [Acetobacteraceae bacterium]
MTNGETDILLRLPPRALAPDERDLVAEWLGLASDIPTAYVSARQIDDPVMFRRVVISASPDGRPTHTIHAPAGRRLWVRLTIGGEPVVELFDSLRAALNSIRRVLP